MQTFHTFTALTLTTRGRSDFSRVRSGPQELFVLCCCQVISVAACMRSELCTFAFPGRNISFCLLLMFFNVLVDLTASLH